MSTEDFLDFVLVLKWERRKTYYRVNGLQHFDHSIYTIPLVLVSLLLLLNDIATLLPTMKSETKVGIDHKTMDDVFILVT